MLPVHLLLLDCSLLHHLLSHHLLALNHGLLLHHHLVLHHLLLGHWVIALHLLMMHHWRRCWHWHHWSWYHRSMMTWMHSRLHMGMHHHGLLSLHHHRLHLLLSLHHHHSVLHCLLFLQVPVLLLHLHRHERLVSLLVRLLSSLVLQCVLLHLLESTLACNVLFLPSKRSYCFFISARFGLSNLHIQDSKLAFLICQWILDIVVA
jgi:hypothetical protein